MGILGTKANPSYTIKAGIVSMVNIFGIGLARGWAPLLHVVATKIPTQRLRDMTYAVGAVFNIAIQFAIPRFRTYSMSTYAGPGSKVGFILALRWL